MNNANDDGGSHKARAFSTRSPNEEDDERYKTKYTRSRGRTTNNINDIGKSNQTKAAAARSPNKEGNRPDRRSDRTADGLSVLQIMNRR
eukprot:scaffold9418_cov42-Cyclotella_meneghiniana.AAC.2